MGAFYINFTLQYLDNCCLFSLRGRNSAKTVSAEWMAFYRAHKKADLKTAFISVFYCHAVVLGLNQVTTELGVVEQSQEDRELNFIANQF